MGITSHRTRDAHRRLLGAVLAVAALTAGVVVAIAPPAQAARSETKVFTSRPVHVRRGGAEYRVQVVAVMQPGGASMQISFTESNNPDGVVRAQRSVSYSHETSFWVNDEMSHGALRPSNAQMGGRGSVDMVWSPSAPADRSCAGDLWHRPGALVGDFVFRTGTEQLGTIEFRRLPGTMRRSIGDPCQSNNTPCPPRSISIAGGDGPASVFAVRGGRVAALTTIIFAGLPNGWFRVQSVVGRVPSDNVTLSANERSGRVRGAAGSWFSGTNTFQSFTDSDVSPPTPCGRDNHVIEETNDGSFAGGLEAHPILGPDLTFEGYATATRVRFPS